jgi:TonB family protein
MKKLTIFLLTALIAAITAPAATAQIKYVAVVETEVDAQSGAAAKINKAEVRQITAVLRKEALKNLPPEKYNIMTSETVQAQGSARLEECSDENCVITLGSMIGADFIVRGIISKFGTKLTVSVDIYETNDGNLVASSELVQSEKIEGLLGITGTACGKMYKKFDSDNARRYVQKAPTPPTYQWSVENELTPLMNTPPAVPPTQISAPGDFKYHWYLNAVRSKIESNWRPASENRNLAVVVSFEIHSDGSAHAIRVTSSSGDAKVDNLAIRAVTISSPFEKLPPDFAGDRVEINFTLRPTRKY